MFHFNEPTKDIAWVVVGIVVFVGFIIAARLVARGFHVVSQFGG